MAAEAPREAVAVAAVLRAQGAVAWEPRVVAQLLEFSYRHVADVLDEARVYAAHRARDAPISLADVRLAAQSSLTHAFSEPLGGEELARIVAPLNAAPLPPLTLKPGLTVPSEGTLLAPNFQVRACAGGATATAGSGLTAVALTHVHTCLRQMLQPAKPSTAPSAQTQALPPPPVAPAQAGAVPQPDAPLGFRLPAAAGKRKRADEPLGAAASDDGA